MDQIRDVFLQTIDIEYKTIGALLQTDFSDAYRAIDAILASEGKIVITGIGKSAIIAQKIVATLNSTGSKAVFLHAADAIHGDLGIVDKNDIVICISKSGNSQEIKDLVPLIHLLGNPLIAMVSQQQSFLAQNASYVIYIPVEKEADPNDLAPTASTTAQMVIGDAIATALLFKKGFTKKDFAKVHPGGNLGKKLTTTVADLIANNKKPMVQGSDTLSAVILAISSSRLGATAVVDSNQHCLGIITDGDLRRMLEKTQHFDDLNAEAIMSANPKCIEVKSLAIHALEQMRQHSITQLLCIDDQKAYSGIIHLHDLLKEGFF